MSQGSHSNALETVHASAAAVVYVFGPCRVDVARHRVTRDGQVVPLTPKGFDLLVLLAASGGRALSRHELMAALWPDTYVEEANLTFQVSTLRKALGEGADAWIETVPRFGYRFAPAVAADLTTLSHTPFTTPRVIDAGTAVTSPMAAGALTGEPRRPTAWVAAVAAAVALVASGVALTWYRPAAAPPGTPAVLGREVRPLTAFVGIEGAPSLSPDGSQVAFHWNGPGEDNLDVYVKTVGGGEPVRLTYGPEADVRPAWSPDGRRIAFLRQRRGTPLSELMVMPALGGTERRLATVRAFGPTYDQLGVRLLTWTPDSRWVALGGAIDGQGGIWLIEADGPARRRLAHAEWPVWGPAVSGDGRVVAFIHSLEVSRSAVHIVHVDGDSGAASGPTVLIDPAPLQVVSVAWEPGDRALVYSAAAHMGRSRLWRVPIRHEGTLSAGTPEPLTVGEQAGGLDVSPSGHLVYAAQFRDTALWRLDLTRPEEGFDPSNLPASTFDEHTPDYSPDGRWLAFASTRSGSEEIWVSRVDGTSPRQMTSVGGSLCSNPRWSVDGQHLVFDAIVRGHRDLYLLDVQAAQVRQLTTGPDREQLPRWSRDGRSIYYSVALTLEAAEVRKMPASGGPGMVITEGSAAQESHDGRWLFVTRLAVGGTTLWRLALPDGTPTLVADDLWDGSSFAVGRRTVYFKALDGSPNGSYVGAVDIETGRIRRVATLGKRWWWGMALSPNGRTLLVAAINSQGTDLMLVEPTR